MDHAAIERCIARLGESPAVAHAERDRPLATCTTMRVGGAASAFCEVEDPAGLAAAVLIAEEEGVPLFVLGGGSNVLVGDAGFCGCCVRTVGSRIACSDAADGTVHARVWAGTPWDELVAFSVERGLAGIEALSGIPGCIGSAVMQNLGAYGQEAGARLVSALVLDRETGDGRLFPADKLGLGYRTSMLRGSLEEAVADNGRWNPSPRWIVLEATFSLAPADEGEIGHAQLAHALGCPVGARMPLASIRTAVLDVRAAKGMVADPDPCGPAPLHDRWSSGSFFTNPVLSADDADRLLPADAPRYPAGRDGMVKTSAAWLIEQAGFGRGWGVRGAQSPAALSGLHTLALTNRGDARAADLVELARTVRAGVQERFGISLVPETVLVGCEL